MRISLDECGLRLVYDNTRGYSKRLVSLRPSSAFKSKSFSYRASKAWNSLPLRTINIINLASLKKMYINLITILRKC